MRQTPVRTHEARILRQVSTTPERILWGALRGRRFQNLKFRRQVPVGRHVVGFLCKEVGLAIDIDHHDDPRRMASLGAAGYRLVHLNGDDIRADLPATLHRLAKEVSR